MVNEEVERGQECFTDKIPSASKETSGVAIKQLSAWKFPGVLNFNPLGLTIKSLDSQSYNHPTEKGEQGSFRMTLPLRLLCKFPSLCSIEYLPETLVGGIDFTPKRL